MRKKRMTAESPLSEYVCEVRRMENEEMQRKLCELSFREKKRNSWMAPMTLIVAGMTWIVSVVSLVLQLW